ncbi:hypothetical protein [Telluria aromaticivorans]|uniref:Uncharacterized protein n=1 Tax=Telluria aromaticivorans TaxID=2725995 RepID=A0A7Y2JXY4_9BURK|nr:hypothetical protein [Telluria aromaticivorans]NNG23057.1 hypothetical protein [Telluria aromaticivorans]
MISTPPAADIAVRTASFRFHRQTVREFDRIEARATESIPAPERLIYSGTMRPHPLIRVPWFFRGVEAETTHLIAPKE